MIEGRENFREKEIRLLLRLLLCLCFLEMRKEIYIGIDPLMQQQKSDRWNPTYRYQNKCNNLHMSKQT